jgi:hypothetical protein
MSLFFWWRRILLEFRNRGIHLVPWLRIRNEEIHLRLEPARIIERASQDSHKLRFCSFKFASRNTRSAFGTKTAFMFSSPDTGREMVTQSSACQSKRLSRHQHPGSESAASHLLTIATMALKHHDRLRNAFVANCAARTAASERYFHVHSSSSSRQVDKGYGWIVLLGVGIGLDNSEDVAGRILRVSEPPDFRYRHFRHADSSAALLDFVDRSV